jgi:multiple sugar transport system permease protein
MKKTKKTYNAKKAAKLTVFYILIFGILFVILTPIYFVVSLSFLSTREAYKYPLPLLPEMVVNFKVEEGERGYLISVYDRFAKEYQTVQDTTDVSKLQVYFKSQLSVYMTEDEISEQLAKFDATGEPVYFSHRKNLIHNYKTFFAITRDAAPAFLRSIQIALLTIAISLVIGGMAGYSFARYMFRGRNVIKFSVLFVRMFPGVAIAVPMVVILVRMGFYDKPLGLALVYSVGAIALTIWITASVFMGIPVSLEEAAQVFGSTKTRAFIKITLPLAFPGLAAAAMYAFLGAWNETVAAIILTQFNPTFSVVVYQSLLGSVGQVNLAAAGGIIMALPAVFFTFLIRKYINQMWGGMTV